MISYKVPQSKAFKSNVDFVRLNLFYRIVPTHYSLLASSKESYAVNTTYIQKNTSSVQKKMRLGFLPLQIIYKYMTLISREIIDD